MTEVYSKKLRNLARDEARRLGINLISGVYACLPGPSYETPAEIRMLNTLGADVVGMSTVPEAIVARQAAMEVLAFALVTNAAAGVLGTPISHKEVLEAGKKADADTGQADSPRGAQAFRYRPQQDAAQRRVHGHGFGYMNKYHNKPLAGF